MGPGPPGPVLDHLVGVGRQQGHAHGLQLALGSHALEHGPAVDVGHGEVEEEHVGRGLAHLVQRLLSAGRLGHPEAGALEMEACDLADLGHDAATVARDQCAVREGDAERVGEQGADSEPVGQPADQGRLAEGQQHAAQKRGCAAIAQQQPADRHGQGRQQRHLRPPTDTHRRGHGSSRHAR